MLPDYNVVDMIEAFKIALGEYGTTEWPGDKHNPKVMKFFEDFPHVTTDETSWCSAFVYWCIKEADMVPKKSLVARDWLSWGYRYLNRRSGTWPYFTGESREDGRAMWPSTSRMTELMYGCWGKSI